MNNKARTVVSLSNKGGVGKTTILYNLGCLLALKHKKVLFVDLDYQSNLTSCFPTLSNEDKKKSCIIRAYEHDAGNIPAPFAKDFKPAHVNKYIDILTSNRELAEAQVNMGNKKNFAPYVLYHVFSKLNLKQKYDYILLDCHNSFSFLSEGALIVADRAITPVTPSKFGISAIGTLIRTLKDKRAELINPATQEPFINVGQPLFIGNMVDFNTKESHEFVDLVNKNPQYFAAMFHRRSIFSKATSNSQSIFTYANSNESTAGDKKAVNDELLYQFINLIKAINK